MSRPNVFMQGWMLGVSHGVLLSVLIVQIMKWS